MAATLILDLISLMRDIAPVAVGLAVGLLARWGKRYADGGSKALWRAVLRDLPSAAALAVLTSYAADQLGADFRLCIVLGTVSGYRGSDILRSLIAKVPTSGTRHPKEV